MYKIIVIDDNELIRKSIKKIIFEQLPTCSIIADASDGKSGMEKIMALKPDIIITDIKMPGFDGLTMIKTIQEKLPYVKVIFITGYQDFEYAHTAIKLHACGFLLKPIHSSKLTLAINNAILDIQKSESFLLKSINDLQENLESYSDLELGEQLHLVFTRISVTNSKDKLMFQSYARQVYSIILHFYWNLSPSTIDFVQETNALHNTAEIPFTIEDATSFAMSYSRRLRQISLREKEAYSLLITHVLVYILDNFTKDISLTSIAQHFSVNSSYLSSLIKKETGENFTDLVLNARLKYAKELLQNPKYRINEVSELSGFKNYTYFYQTFKKQEQVSPKEYRNQFM